MLEGGHAAEAGAGTGRAVLIVDDDPDIRAILREILEEEGYSVDTAPNGLEALEQLRHGDAPGLILLDLMMPVMDGWQFRALQMQDPALARIPIVVLSADTTVEVKAAALGADGFIRKPVDLDTFLDLVGRHVPRG